MRPQKSAIQQLFEKLTVLDFRMQSLIILLSAAVA